MDQLLVVIALGSMLVVGYLAHERGRSQSRWVWTAAVIGPLAIALLYLAEGAAAVRKAARRRRAELTFSGTPQARRTAPQMPCSNSR
jgi:hypothetical protein